VYLESVGREEEEEKDFDVGRGGGRDKEEEDEGEDLLGRVGELFFLVRKPIE